VELMNVTYGRGFAPAVPMRECVERVEAIMEQMPQTECPVRHHFAPGVYVREMTIPAGTAATGAVHKTEHLTMLVKGHCAFTTEEGGRELHAPWIGKSMPGAKRLIVAITDCVLVTIHPTDETDLDKLCTLLTESKPDELLGGPRNRQLLAQRKRQGEIA
jgi:hypothetical protein